MAKKDRYQHIRPIMASLDSAKTKRVHEALVRITKAHEDTFEKLGTGGCGKKR
jgi:hypothetical protein